MKKVSEIMSAFPVTVNWKASMSEVNEKFNTTELSHLIVVDDTEIFKGIISKQDLFNMTRWLMNRTSGKKYTELELNNMEARDMMTTDTVNLDKDTSIDYAAELLLQKKFHSLPVIHNFKAIGILTTYDLLKHYYESKAYTRNVNFE